MAVLLEPRSFKAQVLHQDASAGIAGVLYDCALLLAQRLVQEPGLLRGKVVELGCGTGCAGLTAAALGSEVLLTDRSERALQVARQSAKDSGLRVATERWDWRDGVPSACRGADTVIASDVVYSEDVGALLKALEAVTAPRCVVLLVVKVRSASTPLGTIGVGPRSGGAGGAASSAAGRQSPLQGAAVWGWGLAC